MSKTFALGDVLTITTGRFVCKRGTGTHAIYEILNYMTGDNLYTHQLPRAADECKPWIYRQHPQLHGVMVPDRFEDEAHVYSWLTEQEALFGEALVIEPIPADDHARKDPLEELQGMVDPSKIIVVEQEP